MDQQPEPLPPEEAALGHEVACVGGSLVARIHDIRSLGGREKVQAEHPAVIEDYERLIRRHEELRRLLAERAGAI